MKKISFDQFYDELKTGPCPPQVIDKVKSCLLDTIGAIICGHLSPAGHAAIRFAAQMSSGQDASVLGTSTKLCLPYAAFANAILGSAFDIDDGSLVALGHPGAATISAALGAAQRTGANGADVLKAILLGYEVALLLGSRLNCNPEDRLYGSGSWAASGAAAATGYLFGLKKERIRNAIGVAEAHGPLSPVTKSIEDGAMVKESLGWAALTGVCASFLSEAGFNGVNPSIQGYSFPSAEQIQSYRIMTIYFKKYMCCRWGHAAIDAVLNLLETKGIDVSTIEEVTVDTHSKGLLLDGREICSLEKAQYSLPYCIGAALIDKDIGPIQMSESRLENAYLIALMRKVKLRVDPEIDDMFPQFNSARVSIRIAQGKEYSLFVKNAKGSMENPFNPTDVIDKFLWITQGLLSTAAALDIVEKVQNFQSITNIGAFVEGLIIHKER